MRDFRDAKTMAHSLREALKSKAVETTHSDCLELIARAFGYENWNILSARSKRRVPGRSRLWLRRRPKKRLYRKLSIAPSVEKASTT
jgi:hypothetical protein